MLRRLTFFILVIFIAQACADKNKSVIKVKLGNASGTVLSLEELRLTGTREIETVELGRSGKAKFILELDQPGYYQLRTDEGYTVTLVPKPGETIQVEASMDDFHGTKEISGSSISSRIAIVHDSLRQTKKHLRLLEEEYAVVDSLAPDYSQKLSEIEKRYMDVRRKHHRFTQQFILDDLSSLANIAALYQEFYQDDYVMAQTQDIQFFKLVSDSLSHYYPKVAYVQALQNNYNSIFAQYQGARILQGAKEIEERVPNISLPDREGNIKTLKDLKGKVILLAFWSVNQPESRTNVVNLQRIYKKYHNRGFEIYQISVDKSIPAWEKALDFEEIPWISVIDTAYPGSKTHMVYNVNELPMNYLIDEDQTRIAAKNISPAMLDKALAGMLELN